MKFFYLLFCLVATNIGFSQKHMSLEYKQHLVAAKKHKAGHIENKKQLNRLISKGKLVKIPQRGYGFRVAPLTHSYSYMVPKGKQVIGQLARDFVKQSGQNFFVITSLTRTASKQNSLRKSNINASQNQSTHCYGAAFDISYVRFNNKIRPDKKLQQKLENLLQLYQKQGKIYFVKERIVKCYHIVVR